MHTIRCDAMQNSERNGVNTTAVQCSALPWKPYAGAMQRKALVAKASEANARQCNTVQIKAKPSSVNQCNVKHKAMHMQVRRGEMQWNTIHCKQSMKEIKHEEPGNSENQGRGAPAKILGKPGWGRKCHRSLLQTHWRDEEERRGSRDEEEAKIQAERTVR